MIDRAPRVHNRFKLPFFIVCVVLGVLAAVYGATNGHWALVVFGVISALGSLIPLWVILTGRGNPWWMRSPLDPEPPGDGAKR